MVGNEPIYFDFFNVMQKSNMTVFHFFLYARKSFFRLNDWRRATYVEDFIDFDNNNKTLHQIAMHRLL